MESKIFKMILKIMAMIFMVFTISLSACSCGEDTTVSSTPSENPSDGDGSSDDSSDSDYELGSGGIDGVEANINDEEVSYSESKTTATVKILEKASTNPNDAYDEGDYGISISVSNDTDNDEDEQLAITVSINEYMLFEANKVYEFNQDNDELWSAHAGYCPDNCNYESAWESYVENGVNVIFSKVPTSVGNEVSGEIEIILENGDSIKAEFSAEAESYTFQYW